MAKQTDQNRTKTASRRTPLDRTRTQTAAAGQGEFESIASVDPKFITPLQIEGLPWQPRKHFDDDALEKLAKSIHNKGIQEPLLLRSSPLDGGATYEIISGERRWRCAVKLGLKQVPARIKDYSDDEALEIALVNNLFREDLNAIEEAESIQNLLALKTGIEKEALRHILTKIKNFRAEGYSNAQIAEKEDGAIDEAVIDIIDDIFEKLGMRLVSFVANRLVPLGKMPEYLADAVRESKISMTVANVLRLAKLEEDTKLDILQAAMDEKLSTEQVRDIIKKQQKDIQGAEFEQLRTEILDATRNIRKKKTWNKISKNPALMEEVKELHARFNDLLAKVGAKPKWQGEAEQTERLGEFDVSVEEI